jgi:hypothetical protein
MRYNKSLQRHLTRHPFLLPQKQASPQMPLNSGVVEDASRPRQSLRMRIRRLFGAKRLTTSGST